MGPLVWSRSLSISGRGYRACSDGRLQRSWGHNDLERYHLRRLTSDYLVLRMPHVLVGSRQETDVQEIFQVETPGFLNTGSLEG